jgi:lipoate-protein ligase A
VPTAWRLVVGEGSDGASNMAVDEALLESHASGFEPLPPTLRLYSWSPPALSLGRRQPAAGAHDAAYLEAAGIGLVRRATGGRAVLHEHERTYSVTGCLRRPPFEGCVLETYRRITEALVEALRVLGVDAEGLEPERGAAADPGPFGPPVCFDRTGAHEIAAGGRKLVGSAQLRRRGAFLQHGSILLRSDPVRLSKAIGAAADGSRFVGLDEILGHALEVAVIDAAVVEGFRRTFGVPVVCGSLTAAEEERAEWLRRNKYTAPAWNLLGREPAGVTCES